MKFSPNDNFFSGLQAGVHAGNQAPISGSTSTTTATGGSSELVSSYMGINVSGDLPFNDVSRLLSAFNTAAASKDSLGYPVAGVNGTSSGDMGFLLPTGDYNISYEGTGSLAVSGIGALTSAWQTVGSEQRSVVHINSTPGVFGNFLNLTITNGPGQTVTNIHLFLPGVDYDTTEIFDANFLSLFTHFRQMRFMSVLGTVGSTKVNWSDENVSSQPFGSNFSYDCIVALINETGKDAWINIPGLASDSYVTDLGNYLLTNLNMTQINQLRAQQGYTTPFRIYVEYSNEVWAPGTNVFSYLTSVATSNPSRYDGVYSQSYGPSFVAQIPNEILVGQAHADRLVSTTQVLKNQFAAVGLPDCITPVLGGWAVGPAYSAIGLDFIQNNYPGPVSNYVSYIAFAPYFNPADDSQTNDLSNLFSSIGDGTNSGLGALPSDGIYNATMVYEDFLGLATHYGVKVSAYEGGQGMSGTTNIHVKRLAQVDGRMYKAYQAYFKIWTRTFGTSAPFNHFELGGNAGDPEFVGQYGFWDSIGSTLFNVNTCGKNFPTLLGTEDWTPNSIYCPKFAEIITE